MVSISNTEHLKDVDFLYKRLNVAIGEGGIILKPRGWGEPSLTTPIAPPAECYLDGVRRPGAAQGPLVGVQGQRPGRWGSKLSGLFTKDMGSRRKRSTFNSKRTLVSQNVLYNNNNFFG